jgi:hypothetical protein
MIIFSFLLYRQMSCLWRRPRRKLSKHWATTRGFCPAQAYRIIDRMVANNVMPLIRSASLLCMCLILSACGAPRQIYISSSYHTLPSPGARVSVVGNNMTVLSSAESWLRDRDLYVIELGSAQPHTTPASGAPCSEQCQTKAALDAAKVSGVDYVVLFRVSMEHAPERFSIMVAGFAVKSGKEIFNSAGTEFLMPEGVDENDRNAAPTHILCHALATVWQYRPGGYSVDESMDYCHIPRPHA